MNAVICFTSRPFFWIGGVRAMTTITSATTPFEHHSFSPFRIQCLPSSLSTALVLMFAGSEPTDSSVSAKAETSPRAKRGRYFCFCSSVPKSLSGWGTPID